MSLEHELLEELAACSSDPLRFVLFAFPWGEPGTELAERPGPYDWQVEVLRAIGSGLLTPAEAIQIARASGHGIGKSALIAWIILWAISTFEDTRGVVTANTEKQLSTKTWAELGKWFRLFIGKDFFKLTATALYSADPERERTWRIDMIPWSKERPEAFAGLHNEGKRIVMLFDEGSAIADVIWEVAEGAMTDASAQRLWLAFGNPTQNTGRFKACFDSLSHRWNTAQIDSRDVPGTDLALFNKWKQDYGEDSDFFKVRVRGMFPSASSTQLIPSDMVEMARFAVTQCFHYEPLIFGLDVARFGDNESVLAKRRGTDARTLPWSVWRGLSVIDLADAVIAQINSEQPDAVFIDEGGVGGGVVDYIRRLGFSVIGVNFGSRPGDMPEGTRVANKRAEMFVNLRQWLHRGAIPEDKELRDQLIAVQYTFNKDQAILLEAKEDMRKRGEDSPDRADALALTFAHPVSQQIRSAGRMKVDYDPWAESAPPPPVLPPDYGKLMRL